MFVRRKRKHSYDAYFICETSFFSAVDVVIALLSQFAENNVYETIKDVKEEKNGDEEKKNSCMTCSLLAFQPSARWINFFCCYKWMFSSDFTRSGRWWTYRLKTIVSIRMNFMFFFFISFVF